MCKRTRKKLGICNICHRGGKSSKFQYTKCIDFALRFIYYHINYFGIYSPMGGYLTPIQVNTEQTHHFCLQLLWCPIYHLNTSSLMAAWGFQQCVHEERREVKHSKSKEVIVLMSFPCPVQRGKDISK